MQTTSQSRIGSSIHITGEVTAEEPLVIAGHITGTVSVVGQLVTIENGADVDGDVTAAEIVIRGHIHGSQSASVRIVATETAVIDGKLSAPSVAVFDGASLSGKVEAEGRRHRAALSLAS